MSNPILPYPYRGNGSAPVPAPIGNDSPQSDRLPPHNLRAELGILGSILLNNEVLPAILETITVEDFYRDVHQIVFRAIVALHASGQAVDVITLPEELTRRDQYKAIGGDDFLAEMVNAVPHALDARFYADIVRDKSVARQMIELSNLTSAECYSNNFTAEELAARLNRRASQLEVKLSGWEAPVLEGMPPPAPFPLEVLPVGLAQLIAEVAASIPCPVDYTAMPCLAVASAAIGRSLEVRVKDSWREMVNGWFVTVGAPGTAKSAGIKFAQKPIWRIQADLLDSYHVDAAMAAECNRKAKKSGGGSEMPAPKLRRIKAIDATAESLPPILQDNPRGMVIVHDELAHLINGLNQYKRGGNGNDAQMLLSLWNRAPIMIDRKGNEGRIPIVVPEPFISIVGPMTPTMLDVMPNYAGGKRRDDGFLDRFLFAYPAKISRRWVDDSVSAEAENEWDRVIERLWNRDLIETEDGRGRPYFLDLTRAARSLYRDWYDAQWAEAESPDFPSDSEGPLAKWTAYCVRLALLLHQLHWVYDYDSPETPAPIEVEDVDRAIKLMAYFRGHHERVLARMMGTNVANPDANEVLRWAMQRETRQFSEREARDCFRRRFAGNPEKLGLALGWLEERNFIRKLPPKPRAITGGRVPTPSYEIHPSLSEKRAQNAQLLEGEDSE